MSAFFNTMCISDIKFSDVTEGPKGYYITYELIKAKMIFSEHLWETLLELGCIYCTCILINVGCNKT